MDREFTTRFLSIGHSHELVRMVVDASCKLDGVDAP
jgi:hypothetical protein